MVSGLGVAFWSTVTGIGSAIVVYLQGIALDSEEVHSDLRALDA